MRKWINLCESAPRTLYHGTLKEYLPEIEKHGLQPTVGDFVLNFYDPSGDEGYDPEYDSLDPLVFAAGKEDLQRCVNAIRHRLRAKGLSATTKEIIEQGAIIAIRDEDEQFNYRNHDTHYRGFAQDHPRQVEPGDYYSIHEAIPAYVVTGKRLADLLRRNRIDGFWSPRPPIRESANPIDLKQLAAKLKADGLRDVHIAPEQWLIHFTGYSEEISREGFTRGTPLSHEGWKGAWGRDAKAPGINFAVSADDEQSTEFWAWHTPCAVVFRAAGVSCWHKDGFDQVLFWGPSAKGPIIAIDMCAESTSDPLDEDWRITHINGSPDAGEPMPFHEILEMIRSGVR